VKCPLCVKDGLTSTIRVPGRGVSTDSCVKCFYDETGEFHRHDPNLLTQPLLCSRGHQLVLVTRFGCGAKDCDFRGSQEIKAWINGVWEVMR